MKKRNALCLLTTVLGNKATARYLERALGLIPNLETRFEYQTVDDYRNLPAPFWARLTNPWHSRYLFEQKFGVLLQEDFDLVLANAWEMAVPLRHIAKRVPSAILMDATPHTVNQHRIRLGQQDLPRTIAHRLHDWEFRRALRNFQYFFPMGTTCRDTLVSVYGMPESRCFITLAPQDIEHWEPIERPAAHAPFRLLFVTNDFDRKGGRQILEIFSRFLADDCVLTIVSNDPTVGKAAIPEGVTWIQGKSKDDILAIYQNSDLFVFPTTQDYMPQVVAEALSTGLPVVAASVGDIPDLVRDGETGFTLPYGSSLERWASTIRTLIENQDQLLELRTNARKFAEQQLSRRRFENGVRTAIEGLLERNPAH